MANYRAGRRRVERKDRVRELRKSQTDAERILWQRLRAGQIGGFKFRRQHEFGVFILDFFCAEAQLVVEVDGSQHLTDQGVARDLERTRVLASNGMRVLRFTNTQVLAEIDAVLEVILFELQRQSGL